MNDLIKTGRIEEENTDVKPYVVDNKTTLCEITNGVNMFYYWEPTFGQPEY